MALSQEQRLRYAKHASTANRQTLCQLHARADCHTNGGPDAKAHSGARNDPHKQAYGGAYHSAYRRAHSSPHTGTHCKAHGNAKACGNNASL